MRIIYYSLQRPFHGDKFIGANAMIGYYGYDALGIADYILFVAETLSWR
nr:MAG TPA: hypothetical protein [Caudoviricetes sp.]